MKNVISICGSDYGDGSLCDETLGIAEKIGKLIAQRGAVLVCGGHGGVMEAACRGAKSENGITVGIMPFGKDEANQYIDIAIPTNTGNIRNYLVSVTGDVTIAICGRWGTLNEIAFRMISRKPLILVKGSGGIVDQIINKEIMQGVESNYIVASSPEEAIDKAFEIIESQN